MNTIVGANALAVTNYPANKPQKVNFLQKEAFGGLKVWQASLAGLGLAAVLSGVIILAVRK